VESHYSGIHYAFPYPAVQDAGVIKNNFRFDDDCYLKGMVIGDMVCIEVNNKWIEHYAQMELISHGINNYIGLPVHESSTSDLIIGKIKTSARSNKSLILVFDKNNTNNLKLECTLNK
jgi:hypothetical protein